MSPAPDGFPRPTDPALGRRLAAIRWKSLDRPSSGPVWFGTEGGAAVVLKVCRSDRGHAQETAALTAMSGIDVPRLIASDRDSRLLLLSRLPGAPPPPGHLGAHEAAGRWLRSLHARPTPHPDPMPLSDALTRRVRAALEHVPAGVGGITRIRSGLEPDRPFAPATRVWCHRDFSPRNWLWDPAAGLSVVDLEHSRPDHPAWDLVKLMTEVWPDHPGTAEAFIRGYGPLPDERLLLRLCWLHGLQTRAWGIRQGDAETARLGARILSRLSGTAPPTRGTPERQAPRR